MKAARVTMLAVAATLVMAAIPLGVGTALAGPRPATAVDISFDGYCDGLHLNIPSAGLGTVATLDGSQTGCEAGKDVFGTARPNKNGVYGVDRGIEYVTFNSYPSHMVINKNHTWVIYRSSGGAILVLNSGTWTLGTPVLKRGLPSLKSSSAASRVRPASTAATLDIAFDGYCDGMHIVSPSAGLGSKKLADGHSTGCVTSDVFGSKTKILNKGGTYVLTTYYNSSVMYQYVIFKNHTWVLYGSSSGVEVMVNSGTWSLAVAKASSGGPSGG